MDDEPAAWDLGDDEPAAEEAPPTEETPAATGPAGKKGAKEPKPRLDISGFAKAPKPKYTLHWVRPPFINYRSAPYLYDYRQNYYNDVIDWMNKRNRGIYREEPRAQEWGERMFRTYDEKNIDKSYRRSADLRWITGYRTEPQHYSYHTRAYYSLKYMKIL